MASTYVNDLRLNEMATGDASGTWGTVTNTNLELIGEALGYGTEGITTNANTHTTTVADGATDPGRAMYIEYTGTLDSACTITIAPNTLNRMHFIENGTSGSQNIIIKQGSGATITIPPGDTKAVYLDGAGSGAAVVDAFASLNVVDLKVQDDLTVTDDATIGGTLGVTGVLTATSLDISGDIDVDGTSNLDVVDIDGAVDMASTLQVDGVATFTGRDIHSGGITIANAGQIGSVGDTDAIAIASDGVVTLTQKLIGTELDISGNIDVDGTTNLDVVDIDGAVDMASTLQVDGAITSSAGATITLADNGIALNLISTDADANEGPGMVFYRNSSSPADNDALGQIYLQGENDADQKVTYSLIEAFIDDASDGSEDGILRFSSMVAGTSRNRMDITPAATIFNEDSQDLDFRVESNGNANMLFVDGGNDVVTIGGATGETGDTFSVTGSGANVVNTRLVNTNADANGVKLVLEKNSSSPADNDELGELAFLGNDSAGNSSTYASIRTFSTDVTNGTEDGTITLNVRFNDTLQERIKLQGDSNHITITGKDNDSNQIKFVDAGGTIDGYIYTENNEIGFLDTDGDWTIQAKNDTSIFFAVNGTEGARFNSTRRLLGFTTANLEPGDTPTDANCYVLGPGYMFLNRDDSVGLNQITFGKDGQVAGRVVTSTATSYVTTSDYRMKENVDYTWDATTRLKQLKPARYNWINDATNTLEDGFLAHEVSSIVPHAVFGEKDADEMQGMDYAKLTPLLAKAFQELEARITTLEG